MDLDTSISDLERSVSLCLRDGMCTYGEWPECHPLCTIYSRHQVYTASAGGLVYLVRAVAEGRIGYTPTMAQFAYECTLCEACDICQIVPVPPPHASPSEVIRFLRHQLVKAGLIPKGLKGFYQKKENQGSDQYDLSHLLISESLQRKQATTVFYVGNFQTDIERAIYQAAIDLLEKIQEPFSLFLTKEKICSAELYDLGFWDELKTLVKKQEKENGRLNGKDVLFLDPHCQEFMKKRSPQIVSKTPKASWHHFIEFVTDAFKRGKLKPKKPGIKVSYHDPCRLSRGLGIYEVPRMALSFLGVELIEMKRNKENTYCCGAGGRIRPFSDFSDWVAAERLREFDETGADLLLTACPFCKEQFQRMLPTEKRDGIKDIIEFINEWTQ